MQECKVQRYNDGSWHCAECGIAGDNDEDPADFCQLSRLTGGDHGGQDATKDGDDTLGI